MTSTNPFVLVLAALAGLTIGWAFETWLVGSGSAAFVPSPVLGVTLVLIALAVLVYAWPVRRYTLKLREAERERQRAAELGPVPAAEVARQAAAAAERAATSRRVNPFRAVYALAAAKAASLVGALFLGFTGGTALWLFSRTVVSAGAGVALFSTVCAGVLLGAGLIAEHWCKLPPQQPLGLTDEPSAA